MSVVATRMIEHTVGIGELAVSREPTSTIVTHSLGSCIGVTAWDAQSRAAGMLHFQLPDSSLDLSKAQKMPALYGDTGIHVLVNELAKLGANPRRLAVRLYGGANMFQGTAAFDIGHRNHLAARRALWKCGILVEHEDVGGTSSRTLRLEVGTGKVLVKTWEVEKTARARGVNLLLVDDSPTMRRLLARAIESSNLVVEKIVEAENGASALDVLRRSWVDLVVTDLNMPVMTGPELLRRMRAHAGLRRVPVVVVSTDGTEARRQELEALGVKGFVKKPFRPEDVVRTLSSALGVR
ncbi:MAG TPA: response regulator [Polyangiaceae bacterium]|nr:response regulator [Polyangiaceae bacterium]